MLKRITNIVPVRADSIDSFIKTSEEKGATQVIANAISVDERYPDKTDYAYSAKFESRGADGKRIVYEEVHDTGGQGVRAFNRLRTIATINKRLDEIASRLPDVTSEVKEQGRTIAEGAYNTTIQTARARVLTMF